MPRCRGTLPHGILLEARFGPGLHFGTFRSGGSDDRRIDVVRHFVDDEQTQLRHAHREAERAKLETLYSDFIAEASRLYGEALTRQTEEITGLVQLDAMVGRMHLISDRAVVDAAVRVQDTIVATYLGPNRTLRELMEIAHKGGMNFLTEFGEASRKDLATRATAVR